MVNGLSIGAFNCLCVAYIAEIAPLALRGVVTCMCNFTLAVGPLVALGIVTTTGTREDRWAYVSHKRHDRGNVLLTLGSAQRLRSAVGFRRRCLNVCAILPRVTMVSD